jgi:ribonuclease PH
MNSSRPLRFQLNYVPGAEGSCLVTMGKTQVLCVATVEEKAPPHAEHRAMGWITAEYAMLPRSGAHRLDRQKALTGGRSQEISRLIGRSLRAAVDLKKMPNRTIIVDCDVLRADGGTRTAAINGGFLAMAAALKWMMRRGDIRQWPVRQAVGAISVGLLDKGLVVDMSYAQDKEAIADMNFVMTARGAVVEVQATAEGEPFPPVMVARALTKARRAIRKICAAQGRALSRVR